MNKDTKDKFIGHRVDLEMSSFVGSSQFQAKYFKECSLKAVVAFKPFTLSLSKLNFSMLDSLLALVGICLVIISD